ncbi:ornithine-acyl[acyl carrier protein] N-acyltransferase [Aliiroseovarius halocynthiae]|uniref:L-ornithine N(alpha)-acyltransferase n=1 Tax=Aliiroseovarius halocynthiae TaxID=985055 RepID=A0A545SSA0_9RHOB|nr:GNAT family N-acetyltransferase [Aliiroseovarius halocynthiae]TQV67841.1 GNAT family N-acetyltransferase [Aliiroseovarius halocynthiae]SMR72932.1 ornithine-acyl[acyl carrier protein] N-acyltransferase [Aliiroseovarius halocynthiae]
MPTGNPPRYQARFDETQADVLAAQELRHRCFRGGQGLDADAYDAVCRHVLVEDITTGDLVACFRLMPFSNGDAIGDSYSAQFYELSALRDYSDPLIEMGRFCIDPDVQGGADILRVAWGAMTRYVDQEKIGLMFGCSSFQGTDEARYLDTFALLRDRHIAPKRWLPRVKAPKVFRFAQRLRRAPDAKRAMLGLPPLLRTYLMMGGWVSDHAVVDHDLDTLHVFTGVEIAAVPPARARLLRAVSSPA